MSPMTFTISRLAAVFCAVVLFNAPALAQSADDKGVFAEESVGCRERNDLVDYYDAKINDNRTQMGRLLSGGRCISLKGKTFIPLRTGFATSAVQMTINGEATIIWALTGALVASPPPARESHFNF